MRLAAHPAPVPSCVVLAAGVLLVIPDRLRSHIARALAEHVRQLRRDGVTVPADLTELGHALSVRNAQERSPLDPPADQPDPAAMQALTVNYRHAAAALDVSESTVRRAVADGRLPAVNIGRSRRVRVADLAEYVGRLEPVHPTAEGDA